MLRNLGPYNKTYPLIPSRNPDNDVENESIPGADVEYCLMCPHCMAAMFILKSEINCNVFRHGVYKDTMNQIDPHTPKNICDKLSADNAIFGCGKPFTVLYNTTVGAWRAEICDYI